MIKPTPQDTPPEPASDSDSATSTFYPLTMQELADTMPQIVWVARADGWLEYYNQRWYEYTGLTVEQTQGWGWETVLHPDDLQRCTEAWKYAIETGEPYAVDYRLKRASDGAYRWHLGRALPIHDEEGAAVRWYGTCTDVDDYKRTLQKLYESEERLDLALELAQMGVWESDLTTQVATISAQVARLFGMPPQTTTLPNADLFARVHPDDLAQTVETFNNAILSQSHYSTDYRTVDPDGAVLHSVASYGTIIADTEGRAVRAVGVARDITEERQTVEALRHSEERYRSLVDATSQIVWTNNREGKMLPPQYGWSAYTGQSAEEYAGYGWSAAIHPDDVPPTLAAWEHSVATQEPFLTEHRVRRRDGAYRLFRIRAVPVLEGDGSIREWVGIHTDITEQRALEQQREVLLEQQRSFLREVLFSMTEGRLHLCDRQEDLPAPLPALMGSPVALERPTLRDLRQEVRAACKSCHFNTERLNDLETAVGEAAMNAVVHAGGGAGEVRIDNRHEVVQVWVRDQGKGINPQSLHRATLEKGFTTAGTLGHGFWMILRTSDRVYLLTGPNGTTVVLEQERTMPDPVWLKSVQPTQ